MMRRILAAAFIALSLLPVRADPEAGVAQSAAKTAGLEGRVLWCDATANLDLLSTREGMAEVMEAARRAHFNVVVMDVKPISGHVLYPSRLAPKLVEWKGKAYAPDYDFLQVAIEEARAKGLEIHASINVFSEGHLLMKTGQAYNRPDWHLRMLTLDREVVTPAGTKADVLGADRPSTGPGLWLFTSGARRMPEDESLAVLEGDRVAGLMGRAYAGEAPVPVPSGGTLLSGRAYGREWLERNLQPGQMLDWKGKEKIVSVADGDSGWALMVLPIHPEVRSYELSLMEEIVSRYPVDGLVLDRMRYAGILTDFSSRSRQAFEAWLGQKVDRFPDDILTLDPHPGGEIIPGKRFKEWLKWRAAGIRDFLEEAVRRTKRLRPNLKVGVYVGSWYATYYKLGVNWGGEDYFPGYDWMADGYSETGYAGLVDYITTGCYYPLAWKSDAQAQGVSEAATVEAAGERSNAAVDDRSFVYAGLYLLNYHNNPDAFEEALRAARQTTQGVMIFDLSHLVSYGWWDILARHFASDIRPPHRVSGLLDHIRAVQTQVRQAAREKKRNHLPSETVQTSGEEPGSEAAEHL